MCRVGEHNGSTYMRLVGPYEYGIKSQCVCLQLRNGIAGTKRGGALTPLASRGKVPTSLRRSCGKKGPPDLYEQQRGLRSYTERCQC